MDLSNADTQPMDLEPKAPIRTIAFKFTGSGSEYFRIWIVNLLLLLVTLGIYYPWAKARRMRYFWENTVVDGDPLGFHGHGKNFFYGNLVAGILFGLYSLGASISPIAAAVVLVILALLWPALVRSSLCFRLRNTSWRGVRFEFKGSLRAAYGAVLPAALPFIVMAVAGALAGPEVGGGNAEAPNAGGAVFITIAFFVSLLLAPAAFFWLKKYQHSGYNFANERTRFSATVGSFYKLWLKYFFMALFCVMSIIGILIAMGVSIGAMKQGTPDSTAMASMGLLIVPAMLFIGAVIASYVQSRLQNLVWNSTRSTQVQFSSDLRFARLTATRLRNWILMGLTLGFYWPFAAVSLYRLRIEAISALSAVDLSDLVDESSGTYHNAAGDAAGDFFGLDLGL